MPPITSLSTEEIQELFAKDAVLYVEDPEIGERVKRMQQDGFPIESAGGLDFCEQNIFNDTRVPHVLKALFPWVGLGIYEVYRTDPNHIYAFMTGLNHNMTAITVQLWSPQSSLTVYGGSQKLQINGFNASNGLLEIPFAPLKQAGCNPIGVEMERGGLVIHDARLSFRRVKGFAIHFVFATKEELEGWRRRKLPLELESKAAGMETPTMGLNFEFGH